MSQFIEDGYLPIAYGVVLIYYDGNIRSRTYRGVIVVAPCAGGRVLSTPVRGASYRIRFLEYVVQDQEHVFV